LVASVGEERNIQKFDISHGFRIGMETSQRLRVQASARAAVEGEPYPYQEGRKNPLIWRASHVRPV